MFTLNQERYYTDYRPEPFRVLKGQHAIILGQTGTGKTTLAGSLFWPGERVLMTNPKADFLPPEWMDYRETSSPSRVERLLKRTNVLYTPSPDLVDEEEAWNEVFRAAFMQGDCRVYNDEASMVVTSPVKSPKYFRVLSQQGRSRNVGVTNGTQRPFGIPIVCFSEAYHVYMFRLIMDKDTNRVADWIGDDAYRDPGDIHAFWYQNILERKPRNYLLMI